MLRAIILSLALLIGIGTLVPLATEFAEAGSPAKKKYKKKRVKKYSKRWWRSYNKRKKVKQARVRRTRKAKAARARAARVRRARAARARRARLARVRRARSVKQRRTAAVRRSAPVRRARSTGRANTAARPTRSNTIVKTFAEKVETPKTARANTTSNYMIPAVLPSGSPAPKTWQPEGIIQGELQFRVTDNSGSPIGAASISVVGPAVEDAPVINSRIKTVGGVTTTALRRTVIDQMIRENGWVVNDFQKEIDGKDVYVVVAQSPGANNQVENRMFYFTEVDGSIYSVATKAPENATERLEEESEKVLNSLRRKAVPTQVAANRTVSNLVANEE